MRENGHVRILSGRSIMETPERQEQQLQAENELLLLHLRRVQEELEHYCVAQQKSLADESFDFDRGSRGAQTVAFGKPAFSSALLKRLDTGDASNTDSEAQVDSEMQEKHQAYLDQLRENHKLQHKITAQEEMLRALESRLNETATASSQCASECNECRQELNGLHVEKNALEVQLGELSTGVEELRVENDKLKTGNRQLKTGNRQLKIGNDELKAENGELRAENDELRAKNHELAAENTLLEDNHGVLNASLQQRGNELAASNAAVTQLATEKQQQVGKIQSLAAEVGQLKTGNKALEHRLEKTLAIQKQSEARLVELDARLSEKEREAYLGQKILAKAQIDLADMRQQYAKKLASEQELIDLVEELRGKLELASRYYFQIKQQHPDILNAIEEQKSTQ